MRHPRAPPPWDTSMSVRRGAKLPWPHSCGTRPRSRFCERYTVSRVPRLPLAPLRAPPGAPRHRVALQSNGHCTPHQVILESWLAWRRELRACRVQVQVLSKAPTAGRQQAVGGGAPSGREGARDEVAPDVEQLQRPHCPGPAPRQRQRAHDLHAAPHTSLCMRTLRCCGAPKEPSGATEQVMCRLSYAQALGSVC